MNPDESHDDDDQERAGPDFDVWIHLESGLDTARDDLVQKLPDELADFYIGMGKIIVGAKSSLLIDSTNPKLTAEIGAVFPGISSTDFSSLLTGLLGVFAARKRPWLTQAVELELASEGIGRARYALDRFRQLAPELGRQPIPDRALPYVREAVSCFLFGFDAAAIALCRSILEQVAKEILVRLGIFTKPQLRREMPSLETLLEKLKAVGALDNAYDAAKRVKEHGNTVLHKHPYDDKIRRQKALDSVTDLTQVLRQLLP